MPSLNRPNAPDRLPSSDFENLFGRPRAIRGSDLSSPGNTPSPLTKPTKNYVAAQRRVLRSSDGGNWNPTLSAPLASPSSFVGRQVLKHAQRQSYHSDPSTISPRELIHVPSTPNEAPLIIEEEPAPLNRSASDSSSLSSRTRKILGLPDPHTTSSAGSEQPPSEARSGFKWTREFSGRWLEIRIGRKEQSAGYPTQASEEATAVPSGQRSPTGLPLSHASTFIDPEGRDRSFNARSDQRLLPESRDSLQYAILIPKEGLYCRTKRALGLKHDPIDSKDPQPRDKTSTDNLLDRVSRTLRFLPERKDHMASSASSVSNLSIAAPRWQRIMNRHGKVGMSTSSSIRELWMGKPPIQTPEPEAMYTASDSTQYVAVTLTDDSVAFLPSEARRINTPPLPTDATGPGVGKTRGFFFDYNAPSTPFTPPLPDRPADARAQVGGPRRDSDWYRVKMDAIDAEAASREQLVASVPEHLPNSPLCPRHPRHKSGGMGECPYHGRNPSVPRGSDISSPGISPSENWW